MMVGGSRNWSGDRETVKDIRTDSTRRGKINSQIRLMYPELMLLVNTETGLGPDLTARWIIFLLPDSTAPRLSPIPWSTSTPTALGWRHFTLDRRYRLCGRQITRTKRKENRSREKRRQAGKRSEMGMEQPGGRQRDPDHPIRSLPFRRRHDCQRSERGSLRRRERPESRGERGQRRLPNEAAVMKAQAIPSMKRNRQ